LEVQPAADSPDSVLITKKILQESILVNAPTSGIVSVLQMISETLLKWKCLTEIFPFSHV